MKLNPALVRSAIVSVFALLGSLGVTQWATEANAELISTAIAAVSALVAGIWIRPAVTPNAKVIARVENPDNPRFSEITAGDAVIPESRGAEVVEAATTRPKAA